MKKICYASFCFAVLVAAFGLAPAVIAEEETPAPVAEQQQTTGDDAQVQEQLASETLKKTTHGRSMLSRDDGDDPESGRFMRALSACIRYYTGSSN